MNQINPPAKTFNKKLSIIAVLIIILCLFCVIWGYSLVKYQYKLIFNSSRISIESELNFEMKKISTQSSGRIMPIIYSVNKKINILGIKINEAGDFAPSAELSNIFNQIPISSSDHLADYNGDGFPDLLRTIYSSSSKNARALLFINSKLSDNGKFAFSEHRSFSSFQLKGFMETTVSADFDNDGDLDVFIPMYSSKDMDSMGYSHLLINNGRADFTDISDSAGVSIRNFPDKYRTEGAQAIDINLDGWIDLYTGSHLFVNNQNLTFTNKRKEFNLPLIRDEGAKFLDWNNDGHLDLILNSGKLSFFEYNASKNKFIDKSWLIPDDGYFTPYDLNVYDFNNDGYEDVVTGHSIKDYYASLSFKPFLFLFNEPFGFKMRYNHQSRILINTGIKSSWSNYIFNTEKLDTERSARASIGDMNKDGLVDLAIMNEIGENYLFINKTNTSYYSIFLNISGINDEQNQQGRVVTIQPINHPKIIMTRVVDSGSGYRTQNQYELIVGTPYNEPHIVTVYFSSGPTTFMINAGEQKTIKSNGIIENYE